MTKLNPTVGDMIAAKKMVGLQDITKLPKGLDMDTVIGAVEREMFGMDSPGFCLVCGEERDGCEPDAEGYECYSCEAKAVAGASAILMVFA
jgi:hypothetical protein